MKHVTGAFFMLLIGSAVAAHGASAPTDKELRRIRNATAGYAACVVRKHHDQASEAIVATPSNSAIIRQYPQTLDSDCLASTAGPGIDMRFPNDTFRYALADALVNAEFAARGAASFADRLPLAQPVLIADDQRVARLAKIKSSRARSDAEQDIIKQNALAWLMRYGECVVRQNPEASRYWILTPADTPEESSRIAALQPAFGTCLDNGKLRLNRVMMRGAVAVNYYRLAKATVVRAAGGNQ